jgi:hypothetical protein
VSEARRLKHGNLEAAAEHLHSYATPSCVRGHVTPMPGAFDSGLPSYSGTGSGAPIVQAMVVQAVPIGAGPTATPMGAPLVQATVVAGVPFGSAPPAYGQQGTVVQATPVAYMSQV